MMNEFSILDHISKHRDSNLAVYFLGREALCIMATEANWERAFKSAGNVMAADKDRTADVTAQLQVKVPYNQTRRRLPQAARDVKRRYSELNVAGKLPFK